MSPGGTLTLMLRHSFFVYFGFMYEQMFSVEKTCSAAEFILQVWFRGSWYRRLCRVVQDFVEISDVFQELAMVVEG